ncbi:MAG: DUF1289 domain-containing protein [Pseudomonadota bacterium]|nr:DUF1289 domain-containing protein [Pseudomonadota bacterium]
MTQQPSEPGPENAVPSPCIGVCRISPVTGWCEGCYRRLEEIGGWAGMSNAERMEVWARIDERSAQTPAPPGPPT